MRPLSLEEQGSDPPTAPRQQLLLDDFVLAAEKEVTGI
jgi:hypothetical protein